MATLQFSIGDLVTQLGRIVGRVEYVRASGWAGVRDSKGRVDEYRAEWLQRAR